MKTAFYPCCAGDIEEPRTLVRKYADEIIFCDLKSKPLRRRKSGGGGQNGLPTATFVAGDVREIVLNLPTINVLFYRRDK